ncbi:multidrug effflux MFS transporter [Accumulibacter sp.]|uniref:multidrug effflux MFS transporter n=1 Tax=Accumulibacter sp. TaxID=2053492 RepID=UPI0025FB56AD|nr:multidrug effflux MFS transporter [Accumulibacter sp.]MCM8594271.1 multidrug effflux MFS transporter [Accumulibacter sp.]MCM8627906.1 multidrug effflux MFS transporter [Accumulibacter sp.]MDS4048415.1 multidrug effflux MFS transporter [Accumulibacter sp.]
MNRPCPSIALAALLTTLVALGPLSTDLYLPALPTLARAFASGAAEVQLTLSVFLAGFACGQIIYGPLSDRFGRRPVLLAGLVLYCLGSLGCVLSTSIERLVFARFVQALGACAGPVIGRAVVRDVWGASESARIIAYIGAAMALAPLFGPTIGGLLTVWLGWQSNFVVLLLIGLVQLVAVGRMLAESNVHRDPEATRPDRMIAGFARLLGDRGYLACLLCLAFSYSALFAFISGSSFVLADRHGLSPQAFGACFGLVVAGYLLGSVTSGRLVRRVGSTCLLRYGAWLGALAGAGMAGLEFAGVRQIWALLAPMFLCTAATGLVMPNAISRALAPYPAMAGSASALMGVVQMGVAALVGVAVGQGLSADGSALAAAVAACTLLAALSYEILGGRPAAR